MSGFPTTAWSVVSRARSADSKAREALGSLCAAYWRPLYSFARRSGHTSEDAHDLTQAYFTLLIEKDHLADVRLREGRFRTFLLTSFRHFLSKERDRARALKRGGGRALLSIDAGEAEAAHADEPLDTLDPEALFERRWALTILERAMARLRHELVGTGRDAEFEQLEGYLTGREPKVRYQEAAERLGTTEGAVKKLVHRLRRRFGDLLRDEIAATLADPADVEIQLGQGSTAVIVGGLNVKNNIQAGVVAEDASLTLVSIPPNPSAVQGNGTTDLALTFGARSTIDGVQLGAIQCDATVLSRGTSVCP